MLSRLSVVLYFTFSAAVAAQSSDSVLCVAGQCLQGVSNVTIGAKLSAPGSTSIQLLPGQYTDTTNPQLLHTLLTSSSATLTPSPGFDNATLSSLPLNLNLQPGLAIYQGPLYSGQSAFSALPSIPFGNNSVPLPANSLTISTNVWAAVSVGGSTNNRVVLWESVPDISQLASGATRSLALLDMQSASCSPACSGSGICSANGTCTCPPGFAGTACETCAEGFFGPTCQACPTGCETCDQGIAGSGRCLSPIVPNAPSTCNCINGQCGSDGTCTCLSGWTNAANGTACAKCSTGFFLSTTGTCQACTSGCSQCADLTAECTSCQSEFTLDPTDKTQCNPPLQTATGGTPCPDGSFSASGVCTPCSSTCSKCTGPGPSDCVLCAAEQYLFNGSCVSTNSDGVCNSSNGLIADNNKHLCDVCGASCTSCKYPSFSVASTIDQVQCTGCLPGSVLSNGKCLAQCPSGTFVSPQDNLTCIACSSSCGSCIGSADFCLTCPTGQLASSGQCVTTCPSNTFTSGGQCTKCHPDCATCSGPSFNQCSTCPPSLPVLTSGRCLPTCTKTQFYDTASGSCQACDTTCSSCSASGPNNCLACASSTSVLRSGACVPANCAGASNVIPGLGVCLSDLVVVATKTDGTTPAQPSITGVGDPTIIVNTGRRGLLWWEILLMALGCAFIFMVVIWLFRRRAKKQRAKRTAMFASKKNLDKPRGWKERLVRFGERYFGHTTRLHPSHLKKTPSDEVLPVAYNHHDRTRGAARSRPSSVYSSMQNQDIKLKKLGRSDTKSKKSAVGAQDDDIDMFIDAYNHSAYTRESRAPSTLPGLDERRYNNNSNNQRARQQQHQQHRHLDIERDSIYSQVTGVQRHTPEPRQPIKRGASAASRLSASTMSSGVTRHLTSREGVLVDIDDSHSHSYSQRRVPVPPLMPPLQVGNTGPSNSGYNYNANANVPATEAQRYMMSVRPEIVGVAQPVVGTVAPVGSTGTGGGGFMPIPVTLSGGEVGSGGGGQYWLMPVVPQNTSMSTQQQQLQQLQQLQQQQQQQQQEQQYQYPVPTFATPSHDTVVIQPMNTGGSFSRNPFRQGMF